jgi:hypothetical protein
VSVVKFPYSASRRVHSRRQRRSKNGTPEERAAKAAVEKSAAATVIEKSGRSVVADVDTTAAQRREIIELAKTLDDGQRVLFVEYLRRLVTEGMS